MLAGTSLWLNLALTIASAFTRPALVQSCLMRRSRRAVGHIPTSWYGGRCYER